jgi:hypothetical protein
MLAKMRLMHFRDVLSLREGARRTRLSRNTIRQWLRQPDQTEPKYPAPHSPGILARTSVMISTNLSFSEWSTVFGDAKLTSALLHRLTHHCRIVETSNESWRFRHSTAAPASRARRTPPRPT